MNYDTPIAREALRIWQEFEMQFAPRLRRMHPDAMDLATGAWGRCLREAEEKLVGGEPSHQQTGSA